MTSTRPGCMTGSAARSARVIASSRVGHRPHLRRREPRAGGCASGSYAGRSERERRDRRHRPGQADGGAGPLDRDDLADQLERGVDVGLRGGDLRGGRRVVDAGGARSAGRSRRRPSGRPRPASVPEHQLGRAAADVHDEERARRAGSRPRVAPSKDSAASSSPLTTSGCDAERLAHHLARRPSRLRASRVALVATMRVALDAELAAGRGVVGQRDAGCARAPRGASSPVRSTPWPSRTTRISRWTSCLLRAVDVGDEQADRVGAAVDGGDPHERVRLPGTASGSSGSTHGPARPPVGQQRRAPRRRTG